MEFSTFHSDLAGSEIKPNALLDRYTQLMQTESQALATGAAQTAACPACGSKSHKVFAKRAGFEYASCGDCSTLFTSTRPSQDRLLQFYRESGARRFWLQDIWKETADVRHEKILAPLKDWVETFLSESFSGTKPIAIAEMNAANWGFWETLRENARLQARLVEPMFDPKLEPACETAIDKRDADTKYNAVCLIDALGRVENPLATLQWVAQHLVPQGLCFITTTLSTGFDVQVLGAASEALLPPDRLTLLSLEGLKGMARKAGLEVVEFSTPGVLDLQNVQRAVKKGADVPAFAKYLVDHRAQDPRFTYDFQTFLQSHGLSSQGRLVLRKP